MRLVLSVAMVVVIACNAACTQSDGPRSLQTEAHIDLDLAAFPTIALDEAFDAQDVRVVNRRIYVLDAKSKHVNVFDSEGDFVRSIGSPGSGPGEFERPVSIAVLGSTLFVCERSGRVSVFDTSGTYSHSFAALGVRHMNSNIVAVSDSVLLIGGHREVRGDPYAGAVAHLYNTDGTKLRELMNMTPVARDIRSSLIVGARCDKGTDGVIWCCQAMDYVLRAFRGFSRVDSIIVEPADHKRPTQRQPANIRTAEGLEWISSFDKVNSVYSANDSLIVAERFHAGRKAVTVIDVVDKRTGRVLRSHSFRGRLVDVDEANEEVYFRPPPANEEFEQLAIASLRDLL